MRSKAPKVPWMQYSSGNRTLIREVVCNYCFCNLSNSYYPLFLKCDCFSFSAMNFSAWVEAIASSNFSSVIFNCLKRSYSFYSRSMRNERRFCPVDCTLNTLISLSSILVDFRAFILSWLILAISDFTALGSYTSSFDEPSCTLGIVWYVVLEMEGL